MDKEKAQELENEHNVFIDAENELFNHNGYDSEYGWMPIPDSWVNEYQHIDEIGGVRYADWLSD